jgi:hypothetical protein
MTDGLFGLPEEVLVNNPLDAKENNEHALDVAPHLPHLFWFW